MIKKYLPLSFLLFIAGSIFSQSQRLVLAEEFTQASCQPCGIANPAFNALLQKNSSKIISIKYQTTVNARRLRHHSF